MLLQKQPEDHSRRKLQMAQQVMMRSFCRRRLSSSLPRWLLLFLFALHHFDLHSIVHTSYPRLYKVAVSVVYDNDDQLGSVMIPCNVNRSVAQPPGRLGRDTFQ